jgi:hypothetical protein
MAEKLIHIDRTTPMLLPPDLRDWVEDDDLVHFVLNVLVQQIDDACPYQTGLASTPGAANNGAAINRLVAASLADGSVLL